MKFYGSSKVKRQNNFLRITIWQKLWSKIMKRAFTIFFHLHTQAPMPPNLSCSSQKLLPS